MVFEHENISIKAIFTPGHADGHMIFELSEWGYVTTIFSWDALFQGWVWHTRRWGTEILYESLQKFGKYDDEVMIYSGHDYLETNCSFLKIHTPENIWEIDSIWSKKSDILSFTSLGEERKYNPFLTVEREQFIRLRELRNNF
jgi:hydroxyacylglutathione hydrolase